MRTAQADSMKTSVNHPLAKSICTASVRAVRSAAVSKVWLTLHSSQDVTTVDGVSHSLQASSAMPHLESCESVRLVDNLPAHYRDEGDGTHGRLHVEVVLRVEGLAGLRAHREVLARGYGFG